MENTLFQKKNSCHPRFDLGFRFQFGFSRRIEAVYQDSRVKLVEEDKQRAGINYFLVQNIYQLIYQYEKAMLPE